MRKPAPYVRWLYELLFSLYCALLVVRMEALKEGSFLLRTLQEPLLSFDWLLYRSFHQIVFTHTDFDPPLFFGTWWLLSLILFICLRSLGRLTRVRIFLFCMAGCVTVSGPLFSGIFETSHLVNGYYTYTSEGHLVIARWIQWLEVTVVVTCAVLYLYRMWPANTALRIAVPLLHFSFWGLIIFVQDWRAYLWQAVALLVLPFCTSLVWGLLTPPFSKATIPDPSA
jgi:hypothetical protein